jgi:hypothetical protein
VRCGRERGQGESIGFEFARVGEREDKEGVRGYEACEVKKNGEKLRCLILRRKKNSFIYIYEACTWEFF